MISLLLNFYTILIDADSVSMRYVRLQHYQIFITTLPSNRHSIQYPIKESNTKHESELAQIMVLTRPLIILIPLI